MSFLFRFKHATVCTCAVRAVCTGHRSAFGLTFVPVRDLMGCVLSPDANITVNKHVLSVSSDTYLSRLD